MNILYTITWPGAGPEVETCARKFYDQLREGVAHGARFPFDSPYEIALVRASNAPDATPPSAAFSGATGPLAVTAGFSGADGLQSNPKPLAVPAAWAVAVLANRVTTGTIGAAEMTIPQLESWFAGCIPGGTPPGSSIQSSEATHLKLASQLSPDYEIVANFGTFVGEPDLERAPEPAKPKPPASAETAGLKALVGQPLSAEEQKVLGAPPPANPSKLTVSPPAAPSSRPAASNKTSTCLGISLMVMGVVLIPASLLLGALMALGEYAGDLSAASSPPASATEFLLYLACCPLPILILGISLVFLGIYIPRWLKENQSPEARPKG